MSHYQFIFEDVLNARMQYGYNSSVEKHRKGLRKFIHKYRRSFPILFIHDLLHKRRKHKTYDILFVGTKMMDFVNAASEEYKCCVILRGKRSRKEVKNHNCDVISGDCWIYRLYKAALNKKTREEKTDKIVSDLGKWLKKNQPKHIILFSNTGSFERAIVAAAKKEGVVNIKLQHGMMHHNEGDFEISNVSDYIWVWNDYFKKLILSNLDINPDRIKVFGYPHEVINNQWPDSVKNVCFLGQQDGGLEPTPEQKIEVISRLKKLCEQDDLNLVYRPHPTERREKHRVILERITEMGIIVTPTNETLKDAFRKHDLFISFFSTALIDAYKNKRYCLQVLFDWERKVDNFQEMDIGYTSHIKKLKPLVKYNFEEQKKALNGTSHSSLSTRIKKLL